MSSEAVVFQSAEDPPDGVPAPRFLHLDGVPVRAVILARELVKPDKLPGSARRPPASVERHLDRRLWGVPGVYCQVSGITGDAPYGAYVGTAKDLIERLRTHDRADYDRVIAVTAHDLGQGPALQLEAAMGHVIAAAKPKNLLTVEWEVHPGFDPLQAPGELVTPFVVLFEHCLAQVLGQNVDLNPNDVYRGLKDPENAGPKDADA